MKWLVALTLVAASLSFVVPALLRASESELGDGRLDRIHEIATF